MHNLSCENEFYLHDNEKSFPDKKNWALYLVLIQRPSGTRKWPIVLTLSLSSRWLTLVLKQRPGGTRDDLRSLLSEAMNTPVGYEELAGGLEPIRSGEIFWMNNNVYCMLIDRWVRRCAVNVILFNAKWIWDGYVWWCTWQDDLHRTGK